MCFAVTIAIDKNNIYSVVIFLWSDTFPASSYVALLKYLITSQKIKYILPNCVATQHIKLVHTTWFCCCQNIGKTRSAAMMPCFRKVNFLAAMRHAVFTDSRMFDWLIFLKKQLIN